MMFQRSLMCSCVLLILSAVRADAAVMVSVQNATITTNGPGFVDVLISAAPGTLLSATNFQFEILGSPGPTGSLSFLPTTNFSPPGYVFGPGPGNYFETITPTLMTGGDFFQTGDVNVSLTGTPATLVRLNLLHTSATPLAAVGSTFQIRLVDPLLNGGQTDFQFWDDMGTPGDPLDDGPTSLSIDPLSFNAGTITIASAAVPEPGTIGFMAVLGAGAFIRRRILSKRRDV